MVVAYEDLPDIFDSQESLFVSPAFHQLLFALKTMKKWPIAQIDTRYGQAVFTEKQLLILKTILEICSDK